MDLWATSLKKKVDLNAANRNERKILSETIKEALINSTSHGEN